MPIRLRITPENRFKLTESALFMIFLVSFLSFLCYNKLTICFKMCFSRVYRIPQRIAADFFLQKSNTEGKSYETGKRGNS